MARHALSQRSLRPERMDDPTLDASRHRAALAGLGRIHAVTGTARRLLAAIERAGDATGTPLRVLDLATGGGDVPLRLSAASRKRGLDLRIDGCDVSERTVYHAKEAAERRGAPVRFFRLDALREPLPTGYDVIMHSLFLHHLEENQAVELLSSMRAAASRLVVVEDLDRSLGGLAVAWAGSRLLSRSDVVREDGPQSVRAAFTGEEARSIAVRAGLHEPTVKRHWPYRYLLTWRRP